MERIYNDLKVKYSETNFPSETKNLHQLKKKKEIDKLNKVRQTSEEVIRSLRNLTSIKVMTVPEKENKLNYLQKSLQKEKAITQIMINVEQK